MEKSSGETVAFWWLVIVLFITGGVMWMYVYLHIPHTLAIIRAAKAIHVGAGVGLTIDLLIDLYREGVKQKLRELIRLEKLKQILLDKNKGGGL